MLLGILALSAQFRVAPAASTPESPPESPVDEALSSFEQLDSYKTTLRSSAGEEIKYSFKKPGHIRMEFEKPHKGAVLVYDPLKKEVRLRPLRFWKSFEMLLKPEDSLIKSSRGHTVDESDIGSLLKNVKLLEENGSSAVTGEDDIRGRKAIILEAKGGGTFTTPDSVNMYRLWLDKEKMLPLKVQAFAADGGLLEEVLMDDLEVDPALSMDLFS